jgi:hypothetical protein
VMGRVKREAPGGRPAFRGHADVEAQAADRAAPVTAFVVSVGSLSRASSSRLSGGGCGDARGGWLVLASPPAGGLPMW